MNNFLTVNDPKTGWTHAFNIEVADIFEAVELVEQYKKENKKYQFALKLDGLNTLWYKDGYFVR